MSRRLDLIGIGPGNPDWLTLAAVDAIQHLDVLFVAVSYTHLTLPTIYAV